MPATYDLDVTETEYLRHGDKGYVARVYKPKGAGPFPAVIDAHGGAWVGGDRFVNEPVDRALAARGVVVMAPEFSCPPDATYPRSVADINFAYRWLKANAATYGTRPEMIGTMGTSSGGHLAVLAALKPDDPRYATIPCAGGGDAKVPFVVALWPVICPVTRWRMHRDDPSSVSGPGAVKMQEQYWLTEAAMEEGSVDRAVNRGDAIALPHILYVQHPNDTQHPRVNMESFIAGYRKRGGQVEQYLFEGEAYDAVRSAPESPAAKDAIARIVAFIKEEATAKAQAAAK
jgi:acetyl esterase/lipase